jgi:pilus assembly protein CpaB
MNIRTIATLAVALVLGLVAVLLVRAYLTAQRRPAAAQVAAVGATTPVVVAAVPIVRGVTLQPNLLRVANYPADAVPPGSFRTVNELVGTGPTARLALRSLAPNEPILPSKVSGAGGKLNLSGVLTQGMRAVSLRSNDVAGVAGFVLPGDRVDILLTRQLSDNSSVTQVLAENVRVLGVDQTDNDEADKPQVAKAVTIEVTPDQAQKISLAQTVGSVSLALRHVADELAVGRRATTVADLGYGPRPAAAPRRAKGAPPMAEIRITRGLETSGYPVSRF